MQKIERRELHQLLKAVQLTTPELEYMQTLDVYHVHGWDHDIIFFEDDSRRNEHVPMREFYFDMKEMLVFSMVICKSFSFLKHTLRHCITADSLAIRMMSVMHPL